MSRVTSLSRKVSCVRCRLNCSILGLHVHYRMVHPEITCGPLAYPQPGAREDSIRSVSVPSPAVNRRATVAP